MGSSPWWRPTRRPGRALREENQAVDVELFLVFDDRLVEGPYRGDRELELAQFRGSLVLAGQLALVGWMACLVHSSS